MMYIRSNNEIDKRINVSKIANNISTMGDYLNERAYRIYAIFSSLVCFS